MLSFFLAQSNAMPIDPVTNYITQFGALGLLAYLAIWGIPAAIRHVTQSTKDIVSDFKEINMFNNEQFDKRNQELRNSIEYHLEEMRNEFRTMMERLNKDRRDQ